MIEQQRKGNTMSTINVVDQDYYVRIVHGVVIRGLTGWVGFESLKALPRDVRNLINCGSPNPAKGEKDVRNHRIVMHAGEVTTTVSDAPVEQQWRRGTLAVTTDDGGVYVALTVHSPDDCGTRQNKKKKRVIHDMTKRYGRDRAYKALKALLIDLAYAKSTIIRFDDVNQSSTEKYLDTHKDEIISKLIWCYESDGTDYYIRIPECNFAPKLEWAIEMQRWVKDMLDREAKQGEINVG